MKENKNSNVNKVDWHKNTINDDTIITASYKNTQNVRAYFRAKLGHDFKFDRGFMEWMKGAIGLTMREACREWKVRQHLK
ncbi:DUF6434 domain-containing protein [Vibrio rotiferianus]|uniref:DUF6434 domain-containing protein n=1 Tax=Vibrio rotiferianus TaxID=190895 RepID=UPI000B598638|nr:DUF6434 domain-containing protein [Vibrio rotiferianus]ASI93910.1 hypothetical protein BSZ04_02495 [Vibrio rotiferianus]